MAAVVISTEPPTVENHKNVHIEECTLVSRRHIQQTRCRHISCRWKIVRQRYPRRAADVESTNERLIGNVIQYHTTDRTAPSMHIVALYIRHEAGVEAQRHRNAS